MSIVHWCAGGGVLGDKEVLARGTEIELNPH